MVKQMRRAVPIKKALSTLGVSTTTTRISSINSYEYGAHFMMAAQPESTDNTKREGNQIVVKSINYRFQFWVADTPVQVQPISLRHIILLDRRPQSGGIVAWSGGSYGNLFRSSNILSPYAIDPENQGRFKVLMDEMYEIDQVNKRGVTGKWFYNKPFTQLWSDKEDTQDKMKKNQIIHMLRVHGNTDGQGTPSPIIIHGTLFMNMRFVDA